MKREFLKSCAVVAAIAISPYGVSADEFDEADLKEWNDAFMSVVEKGRAAFTDPTLGGSKNGVVCAQCHPNGANTHPETYPKFQQQIGRVITLQEMANWCIQNPLEGTPLKVDDPQMTALITYMTFERRGVALDPGKH
ncbi:hypothetical protein [Kordiimonas aestuarii]|uniref:hypothetical protein n=1 Tax=Kordiimonas aestuarii TaxID=1005925 RepID=UPI0021CE8F19|nr:hypothetical protein [Kordiimonas aestuarii]